MKGQEFIQKYLYRFEPLLFWCCAIAFILPIWLATGIYTYDGPAHLYNARQLWEILVQRNDWLLDYYTVNTGPDNWLVHGTLMLLQGFFGAVLAEKLWLSLYVLVFITGFRRWMLYMQQTALSWWVFLLPYFFNLLMGQYSFAFSVALFPYFMLSWQQFLNAGRKSALIWSAAFLFLLYLTHVVSFGIAGIAAGLLCLGYAGDWRDKGKLLLHLAGIALPGLLLSLLFLSRHGDAAANQWLPLSERLQYLLDARALIGYSYSEDVGRSRLYAAAFVILFFIGFWRNRTEISNNWAWLAIWVVLLLLNIVAPDQSAGGGFIQTRLNILLLLYSPALLATFRRMFWWYVGSVPLVLFVALRLGSIHYIANENLAVYRSDWEAAARLIPAESTVLTFNYSPLWLQHHIHTLIGQDKALVHVSNYEADNHYFPLRWQSTEGIQHWLTPWTATKSLMPCELPAGIKPEQLPDYLLVYFYTFGKEQACTAALDSLKSWAYAEKPLFSSDRLQLYARR